MRATFELELFQINFPFAFFGFFDTFKVILFPTSTLAGILLILIFFTCEAASTFDAGIVVPNTDTAITIAIIIDNSCLFFMFLLL